MDVSHVIVFCMINWLSRCFAAELSSSEAEKLFSALDKETFGFKAFQMRPHLSNHVPRGYTKTSLVAEVIAHRSNKNIQVYNTLKDLVSKPQLIEFLRRNNPPECQDYEFYCTSNNRRTINGTCNNLQFTRRGAALTPFSRLLAPEYQDGFNSPRSQSPSPRNVILPNVRKISTIVHHEATNVDRTITNMVPQFGQFLDHDISLSAESSQEECCDHEDSNADCFPISIPRNDIFYSRLSERPRCLEFTRSSAFCFPGDNATRNQFNLVTSYIDASHVYGSTVERQNHVRLWKKGLLRTNQNNEFLLPRVADVEKETGESIPFSGEYLAGDSRVNEMPALAVMHTLFVREHNRIAEEIYNLIPMMNDEEIFQNTRRILVAEWQSIVYRDFLPIILGTEQAYEMNKDLRTSYNPSVDPSVANEFATAAFRFGHTLVPGMVRLARDFFKSGAYNISEQFFEFDVIEQNYADGYNLILGGLMLQNAEAHDPFITSALTNLLERERTESFGSDLAARNIQRGRDHGIPPYHKYRTYCRLPPLHRSWGSRPREIKQAVWANLRRVYSHPYDIDLFTGGISETSVSGGITGPTFSCILAEQFIKLRAGDRFFYTHSSCSNDQNCRTNLTAFTDEQIQAIENRTLAHIICDNTNLEIVTANVFRIQSDRNRKLSCNRLQTGQLNIPDLIDHKYID